jgi:hypothetical protein
MLPNLIKLNHILPNLPNFQSAQSTRFTNATTFKKILPLRNIFTNMYQLLPTYFYNFYKLARACVKVYQCALTSTSFYQSVPILYQPVLTCCKLVSTCKDEDACISKPDWQVDLQWWLVSPLPFSIQSDQIEPIFFLLLGNFLKTQLKCLVN